MRKLLLPLFFVFMVALPFQAQADTAKPDLYGVLFYADWCGSCKILDPQIEKARLKSDLDSENILFVTLDLTDKTSRHQSKLLAQSLGFGDLFVANNGKTGFMSLIDVNTSTEVKRLDKTMDSGKITKAIQAALEG